MGEFTDDDWRLILKRIRAEECVPFLGAGASMGYEGQAGLPTGGEVAEAMARDCGYPGKDRTDFLRVAQYYETAMDADLLRTFILKQIKAPNVRPGLVHSTLAALPLRYVLTTNFDTLMEEAFRANPSPAKTPQMAYYNRHDPQEQALASPTVAAPLVYKLHGSLEDPMAMIVTEDDVVDFVSCILVEAPRLPSVIKSLFKDSSLLFIGYGLKDWNVRILLRAIRGGRQAKRSTKASYAIQHKPDDRELAREWENSVKYWDLKEGVRCCNLDAVGFVTELKRRYDAGEGS